AVNMAPLDARQLEAIRNELGIGYRLGLLMAQWHHGQPQRERLQYRGEIADKNTRLISAAFAAGLLENALEEEVNIVNAEVLLRERGIELLEESRSEIGGFRSLIVAEVETDVRTYSAAATVFGQKMLRLVQLDGYRLEGYFDGTLLIFSHQDVPGIIGGVGTIFGRHQVNIAQMAVGRASDTRGNGAVGVLNLDSVPSDEALAEVAAHPHIKSVDVIQLPKAGEMPPWLG